METLTVQNFSVVDKASIEVKPITLLIGPQSSGKSILAKLAYFFQQLSSEFYTAISKGKGRRELNKTLREKFHLIFPDYFWSYRKFNIQYTFNNLSLEINNEQSRSYKSLKFVYSPELEKLFLSCHRKYQAKISKEWDEKGKDSKNVEKEIRSTLDHAFHGIDRFYSEFIPAGRSFFAQIEKSIFAFYTSPSGPYLDQIIMNYGLFLDRIKNLYRGSSDLKKNADPILYELCTQVIGGVYDYFRDMEIISYPEKKIVSIFKHSSSGQQEATHLLVALMLISTFVNDHFYFFVEEPEAHLYPESQRKVVDILSLVHNILKKNTGFFITTHSPYILTSFNNLIQANNTKDRLLDLLEKKQINKDEFDKRLKKLEKVVPEKKHINFNDVSAYAMEDGKTNNILCTDTRLVDAVVIDSISSSLNDTFNLLLDIVEYDINA